ncbi:SHOCT domain-containing protein [Pseudodesulfovibrio sediminis]|uniref:SHOCT domain-containing protein n=1 Tax=Pseudodesulfovibrio sediminis TaxID=2810563 RepID=A0ABN6EMY4_9BACT|nr:SHOCT domain-containing protein [Pseudodesulfovibrio sediminis]BCS87488.1 hypothetical protein PSDVSF_07300 [Pseudodesulfovibrio sediminis]
MFNCNWGFMTGFGPGGGMGGFGFLFNLFIFGLLIFLAYKLIQRLSRPDGTRDREDSLEILKRKYANGEITTEEFSRMREILRS